MLAGASRFHILILVALMLVAAIQPVSAMRGRCTLQVDGKSYINGPCDIDMQQGGSFQISPVIKRGTYFATVQIDKDAGNAMGFWNGVNAESHAHDELGTLVRQGACWVNSRAKVCATAGR